ncbi:hypothetical protein Barb7_02864 [Bacteroidales bacterium Barb7]|nr:hypothetical protein Barb7_02864 [Bacteroidales bacterium Barb7]
MPVTSNALTGFLETRLIAPPIVLGPYRIEVKPLDTVICDKSKVVNLLISTLPS